MSATGTNDWDPGIYERFRGLRLRPALDLLAQVPGIPGGAVVDLGCGNGAVGPVLRARFPDAPLLGVDASPAMLARAGESGAYDQLERADIAHWQPDSPPALLFSNAALHWLGDHPQLMPRLAGMLAPGGVLAVQMPANFLAPSHALLRAASARHCPERLGRQPFVPPVAPPGAYLAMLAPLGQVDAWETTYYQRLEPISDGGHPVRGFTESTAMRPYLEGLEPRQAQAFIAEYEEGLALAYPPGPDGAVLFPFRRLFLTFRKP